MRLISKEEQNAADLVEKLTKKGQAIGEPVKIILGYGVNDRIKPATANEQIFLLFSGMFASFSMCTGSSLPLARNTVMNAIYENHPDFTHVLFIDGDIKGVTTELVNALVDADKDIIGPLCTARAAPFNLLTCFLDSEGKPTPTPPADFKQLIESKTAVEVNSVATGCCLIKRKVFDQLGEKTPDGGVWFTFDRHPRESFGGEAEAKLQECYSAQVDDPIKNAFMEGVRFGLTAHIGTSLPSEDNEFCWKARREGFKVWCHLGYEVLHIGDCAYGMTDHFGWRDRLEQGVHSVTVQGVKTDSEAEQGSEPSSKSTEEIPNVQNEVPAQPVQ